MPEEKKPDDVEPAFPEYPGKVVGSIQIHWCPICGHHRLQHEEKGCTAEGCICKAKNPAQLPERDAQP